MDYYKHDSSIVAVTAHIGNKTKVWHFCHVMDHANVGENCVLGQNVMLGKHVQIGNNVKIQNNVSVYEGVVCEDDVFLGPSMVFTNVINPRSFVSRKDEFKKTLIKKGASIGANATIICGNTIGEYAMIGAGSVVTKDIKNYALVVGNPASQIGWISQHGERLNFNNGAITTCPLTGLNYKLENDNVICIDG